MTIEATRTSVDAQAVAQRYFAAISARDVDAMLDCWRPGGVDHMVGEADLSVPEGLRDHFEALFAAFPDFTIEVDALVASDDTCAVRWTAHASFVGSAFQGIAATGHRTVLSGCDVLRVEDGLIVENHAYYDTAALPRDIGLMPARGSAAERFMRTAFNGRTALKRALRRSS